MDKKKVVMQVPFFQVPNDIFEIDLEKHELLVYMYLARCGNQGNVAFPSYNTIARKTSMSRRKAIDCVKSLESKGLLLKETRYDYEQGEHYSNIYKVVHNVKNTTNAHSALGDEYGALCSDSYAPYKELGYKELDNKENIHLPEEDDYLSFYLKTFKTFKGKNHMRVAEDNYYEILEVLEEIKDYDVTLKEWQEAVTEHFKTLPKSNNGNIIAFLKAKKRYFDIG